VLISQRAQKAIPWVTGTVLVQNIALNLIFIPQYSYKAAAALTSISQATLALGLMAVALRSTGTFSPVRVLIAPTAGCVAIGAVALAAGTGPLGLFAALTAYAATAIAVERIMFPNDLRRFVHALRRGPLTTADSAKVPGEGVP
jgi:O-antigen/teichoic acid export membrane protein